MSLSLYKKKRRFEETPEPQGKEKSSQNHLRFVVQKHDASHLHYDFRLEMEGVLKSWAVPKGPSLNPIDKRLAMMVEDHPYDYRDFEGVIPEGNYGGGTVIVWDEGFYEPLDGEGLNRKEQEKLLLKQLHSGSIKIFLHGQKLKGEFALFLMKGRGERSWILLKHRDENASEKDITSEDRSVKTGKSMIEVAADNGTTVNHPELHKNSRAASKYKPETAKGSVWKSNRGTSEASRATSNKRLPKKSSSKKSAKSTPSPQSVKPSKSAAKKKAPELIKLLADHSAIVRKSTMPSETIPMMANLVDEPFDDGNWLYEIKWDGYRAVAYVNGDETEIFSRNLLSFTDKYAPVTTALQETGLSAVLDGEIVTVNEKGISDFQSLQNWQNTPVHLQFYIFDILWLDGYDLTKIPLIERKKILKEILPEDHGVIKYSDHIIGKGKKFFSVAMSQGLEGIMAKKSDSIYQAGARTDTWLKIKVSRRQEVVITGFTKPRNSRKYFGALLLGVYEGNELVYIGHTGSGFNTKSLEEIYNKLQDLVTNDCPFKTPPKANMPVTWVKPKLVCEIKFSEWTKELIARHPIFMGLRIDKKPKDVTFEKSQNMAKLAASKKSRASGKLTGDSEKKPQKKSPGADKLSKSATSKSVKSNPSRKSAISKSLVIDVKAGKDQAIVIDGQELKLTNLNKLYWEKEGFSKGDMINYYLQIAPYIMPYMKDRPQSMNRHPNGIDGPNFFQKNTKGKVPEWIKTHRDFSESTNEHIDYLVCSDEATLIYMANSGCIELNPWHSRIQSWQYPDWCLIDLDPDKKTKDFELVMEVAKVVKKLLDSIGAQACCKTSGSAGIHIYIPLGAKYDFDQSKQLAELIVTLVNHELPDVTSMERTPAKRHGKLYLDYLQNRQTQTVAAPYSLRPKPGVPVSTPLDWSELKKGLKPTTYNARNIFDRLKIEGDLFKPVLGKGIDLEKVLDKLAGLMKQDYTN